MSETSSERNEQRRKLLKKAAVAPAIFVLPVGTALAASSLTCIDKGLQENPGPITNPLPPEEDGTPGHDIWVRRYTEGSSIPGGNKPGSYLEYDPLTGNPVAFASCWNSVVPSNYGTAADGTNLIK